MGPAGMVILQLRCNLAWTAREGEIAPTFPFLLSHKFKLARFFIKMSFPVFLVDPRRWSLFNEKRQRVKECAQRRARRGVATVQAITHARGRQSADRHQHHRAALSHRRDKAPLGRLIPSRVEGIRGKPD